jgi:hypothetical protein
MSTTTAAKPKKPTTKKRLPGPPVKTKPAKANSFVAHAEKILRAKGEPMHVKDLTAAALKAGLKTGGKTPEATMAARLGGFDETVGETPLHGSSHDDGSRRCPPRRV